MKPHILILKKIIPRNLEISRNDPESPSIDPERYFIDPRKVKHTHTGTQTWYKGLLTKKTVK